MNKEPIENARDADLRLSKTAMQRAARRARELAAQTGTAIVVSRHGVLEEIAPRPGDPASKL
jgi:LDH2 family malate/lactate/ureidoglycolate dehydrogenase